MTKIEYLSESDFLRLEHSVHKKWITFSFQLFVELIQLIVAKYYMRGKTEET